jgi:hypothetical protein
MIDLNLAGRAIVRAIFITAVAPVAAVMVGSGGAAAQAQTSRTSAVDSLQTATMPTVPLDERQPPRVRPPANVRSRENAALSSERNFDRQLRICRGC